MSGLSRSLAAAIAAYVLIVLVLVGCQRSFLYFPDKTAPEAGQTGVQVVKLLSEPDLELVHLYHPPRALDGPVVVVFHGNAGHAGHRVPKFRALLNAGFGVFFVEYRGYGGLPGKPTEQGLRADAQAALDVAQQLGWAPANTLITAAMAAIWAGRTRRDLPSMPVPSWPISNLRALIRGESYSTANPWAPG